MLIRMTPMLLPTPPSEKPKCTFLPSGLEHPAFSRFQGGRSGYVLCYKRALESVRERGMLHAPPSYVPPCSPNYDFAPQAHTDASRPKVWPPHPCTH